MQRSRNVVINWLSRVTTPRCGRKKRACERTSISRARSRSSRCNSRSSDPNFCSPRNGHGAFCACHLRGGVIYRSYFPSSGRGAPNESFVPFYCSAVRIHYNGGFGFAEIRYSHSPCRYGEPCFKQNCSMN